MKGTLLATSSTLVFTAAALCYAQTPPSGPPPPPPCPTSISTVAIAPFSLTAAKSDAPNDCATHTHYTGSAVVTVTSEAGAATTINADVSLDEVVTVNGKGDGFANGDLTLTDKSSGQAIVGHLTGVVSGGALAGAIDGHPGGPGGPGDHGPGGPGGHGGPTGSNYRQGHSLSSPAGASFSLRGIGAAGGTDDNGGPSGKTPPLFLTATITGNAGASTLDGVTVKGVLVELPAPPAPPKN